MLKSEFNLQHPWKKVRSSQHWKDWDRKIPGQLPRQPRLTSKLQVRWETLSQKNKVTIKQDTWHQTLAPPPHAHTHIHMHTHILTQKKRTRKCYLTTDSQRKHGRVNRSREQSNLTTSRETRKIISHHHKRRRRVSSASSERALLDTFSIQNWQTITFYCVKPLKSGHIAYQAKQGNAGKDERWLIG